MSAIFELPFTGVAPQGLHEEHSLRGRRAAGAGRASITAAPPAYEMEHGIRGQRRTGDRANANTSIRRHRHGHANAGDGWGEAVGDRECAVAAGDPHRVIRICRARPDYPPRTVRPPVPEQALPTATTRNR